MQPFPAPGHKIKNDGELSVLVAGGQLAEAGGERSEEPLDLAQSLRNHRNDDPPPIVRIVFPPRQTRPLEAVDHCGDGARGQSCL
jgi:hypothetical protein